jgi:uncharacterized SAM-binding protein YcdF (DUF218 family)
METLFFWLSKLAWLFIAPESVLLLLVVSGWLLLMRGAHKWAKRVLGAAVAAMLVTAFLPVGEWILYPLEARFPVNPPLPPKVHGIIVLGGPEDTVRSSVWEQVEVNDSAERFLASIALARRYPEARLVFTSGSGSLTNQVLKGAQVARRLYEEQGLDVSRIIFESESRNTAENVSLSRALAKPAPGETWVLITSAFHMPRSVGIFCKAGWAVQAFPIDHRTVRGNLLRVDTGLLGTLSNLSVGIREWLGLAAYYATGRTAAFFPAGCGA